jgi:hypothetical protein
MKAKAGGGCGDNTVAVPEDLEDMLPLHFLQGGIANDLWCNQFPNRSAKAWSIG